MSVYPKRLIEVDLPIKKISAHARREKSIRHGHISTLHIWWARRPLAACRAVLCAALWPDPADPLCPQKFREDACRLINEFAAKAVSDKALSQGCSHDTWKKWQTLAKTEGGLDATEEAHWNVLRFALLDFIADFANWDSSTVPEYLQTARALTQSAHESLGGAPGTRPMVVDPFAGGGSIPLEALRIGADAFASDLNPVAVLLNKVVLEYAPRYQGRLSSETKRLAETIKQQAEAELAEFFPDHVDGATPVAYLWARVITCEGPGGCGIQIPLIRSCELDRQNSVWLRIKQNKKHLDVDVVRGEGSSPPTIRAGSVTCPVCNYSNPSAAVRKQLQKANGGASSARLLVRVARKEQGLSFEQPTDRDRAAVAKASAAAPTEGLGSISSIRPAPNTRGVSAVTAIGMLDFRDVFSPRQRLVLSVVAKQIEALWKQRATWAADEDFARAVCTTLACVLGRVADYSSSLCTWVADGCFVGHTFTKQALPNVWDFAEVNPFAGGSGSFDSAVSWVCRVLDSVPNCESGSVALADARKPTLPDDSADLCFTDPPYYAEIPYADLSDFFYVWLRKALAEVHPALLHPKQVQRNDELIVTKSISGIVKDSVYFERGIRTVAEGLRLITKPASLVVIVFANAQTAAWEALLSAVVEAGLIVSASWPIDTERAARTRAQKAASLESSVHLVCRPRENADGSGGKDNVGEWRDVLAELPRRIHEWMPRLAQEGVVGADAIFSCLGPALEIFSRYSRVEKPNGDQVKLKEYLEYVWAAVSKEAISMIFAGADTSGFEEDARLTAMWLWTLSPKLSNGESAEADQTEDADGDSDEKPAQAAKLTGFTLEYDAARKIAQGLGAHLELLGNLVEVKGETARLLPVAERTKALFGKEGTESPAAKRKKSAQLSLPGLLEELEQEESGWTLQDAAKPGVTTLDRLHQAMILFAAGRGEGLRRFLVDDGVGKDQRFWRLAQALCALYPSGTDERRWAEGVLARKKGLGL